LEELSPVMEEIYQAVALPEKSSALMRLKLLSAIERFKDLLESKGIELIIPAVGQDFNPAEHKAVAVWDGETGIAYLNNEKEKK